MKTSIVCDAAHVLRSVIGVAIFIGVPGCAEQPPSIDPPVSISAEVKKNVHHAIQSDFTVEVPLELVDKVFSLVKPDKAISGGVSKEIDSLVAVLHCKNRDGVVYDIFVRDMGANPAAVSIDDKKYFWGDSSSKAGARDLLSILLDLVEKRGGKERVKH